MYVHVLHYKYKHLRISLDTLYNTNFSSNSSARPEQTCRAKTLRIYRERLSVTSTQKEAQAKMEPRLPCTPNGTID